MMKVKEILDKFDEVKKQFLSDIENSRKDGLYILDTDLFKQFLISSQISTLTSLLEAIPEKEEYPETEKVTGNLKIHRILGINQERQRQRQSLQLAIKEWSELK